jgi:hypothetical protein
MSTNPMNGHVDDCGCVNCEEMRRRAPDWNVGGLNDNLVTVMGTDGLPTMIAQCPVKLKHYAEQIVREHNAHDELVAALAPFAAMDFSHFEKHGDEWVLFGSQKTIFTMGHWRAARAAMAMVQS